MDAWAPLGLISTTAALLALPVAPAFYELWKRGDVTPLPISRHDGKIANFADAFCSRLEPLRPMLAKAEISRTNADGMEVLLVGRSDFNFDPSLLSGVAAVMCKSCAVIPPGRVINADVYTDTDLKVGQNAALRAGLAAGNAIAERHSAVLRWLHACGRVHMCEGSTSYGRLSALESIRLDRGCSFQHVHAPCIRTADPGEISRSCELNFSRLQPSAPNVQDSFSTPPRIRVHGDFVLPAGEIMQANLIATGELRLGMESRVVGNVKSYNDTIVGEAAFIQGSIICGGTVHLGAGCFVAGPIIAERDVIIRTGSRVGSPEMFTTISCCCAQIGTECQLHGTVWARVRGTIED